MKNEDWRLNYCWKPDLFRWLLVYDFDWKETFARRRRLFIVAFCYQLSKKYHVGETSSRKIFLENIFKTTLSCWKIGRIPGLFYFWDILESRTWRVKYKYNFNITAIIHIIYIIYLPFFLCSSIPLQSHCPPFSNIHAYFLFITICFQLPFSWLINKGLNVSFDIIFNFFGKLDHYKNSLYNFLFAITATITLICLSPYCFHHHSLPAATACFPEPAPVFHHHMIN